MEEEVIFRLKKKRYIAGYRVGGKRNNISQT